MIATSQRLTARLGSATELRSDYAGHPKEPQGKYRAPAESRVKVLLVTAVSPPLLMPSGKKGDR
jgi:hypothetical protein